MKKLFYLFLIAGLVASSCKKPADVPTTQDVSFKAIPAVNNTFKESVPDKWPDCLDLTADYALITINGVDYWVEVFYLDNVIYTNTLKFPLGDYTVDRFWLYNNGPDMTQDDGAGDDVLIQATPLLASVWGAFVNYALPIDFRVEAFMKTDVNISTICFEENLYEDFGFAWFTVEEVIVREVCFYGDFCTKYYTEYGRSIYANQANGLQHDMPAIFKIDVYRNHLVDGDNQRDFIISYNNAEWLGEGAPLCVKYPDYKNVVDNFEFTLSILVKVGADFEYVPFHTFTTMDAQPLANIGADNVLDFVLGSCVTEADLILPPYMNLPPTATMATQSPVAPGFDNSYITILLSNVASGYEIGNGKYGSFCADHVTTINVPGVYPVSIHSSLYPDLLPGGANQFGDKFDSYNWLRNNLDRYPGHMWYDLQNAFWLLNDPTFGAPSFGGGVPAITPMATRMYDDALALGDGYLPPVGGWAAVLFLSPAFNEGEPQVQLLFIMVDP